MNKIQISKPNEVAPPMTTKHEISLRMYEMVIARQIARIIPDLKLVDVGDYIAYLHEECYANIADIIDTATELHFLPHTLRFADSGEFDLDWNSTPIISLDMQFANQGVLASFRLTMAAETFNIQLGHIDFKQPSTDPDTNTGQLIAAFTDARIKKSSTQ